MMSTEEQTTENHSSPPPTSTKSDVVELLSRHAELAKLELHVEMSELFRRMRLLFCSALLFSIGFCFLQVTIFMGLVHIGMSIWAASLLLGLAYIIISGLALVLMLRRDKKLGEPFEGTGEELKRTLQWMLQRFS